MMTKTEENTTIDWDLLKTWVNHLEKVKEENFDMNFYRKGVEPYREIHCDSVGCVIGHMVKFATKPVPILDGGIIYFDGFAQSELGISRSMPLWHYLFGSEWSEIDNTIQGAIDRINYACEQRMQPSSKNWFKLCPWMSSAFP